MVRIYYDILGHQKLRVIDLIYLLILFINKTKKNNLNLILGNLITVILSINLFNLNRTDRINIFSNLRFNCYSYEVNYINITNFWVNFYFILNDNRSKLLMFLFFFFFYFYFRERTKRNIAG